jgi:hypothetical protein
MVRPSAGAVGRSLYEWTAKSSPWRATPLAVPRRNPDAEFLNRGGRAVTIGDDLHQLDRLARVAVSARATVCDCAIARRCHEYQAATS